jgi:para-aminobenzoate N-oxygenase AurF
VTGGLAETVATLTAASRRKAIDPYAALEWPRTLDRAHYFMSPELISLHGTETWESLDEPARHRLSFWETVNFFSLNIHGERPLVAGLAARLYRDGSEGVEAYLHHFLDEENDHMVYFGGFCRRYAGKVYPDRKLAFPREYAPGEEDFLFFAQVLLFEEIVDAYDTACARDERLEPTARRIHLLHHLDESRHLVFGRRYVAELFERHAAAWSAETLARVRSHLAAFLTTTWGEYYNPSVYADAGLAGDAYAIRAAAFVHPRCREHRRAVTAGCRRYLRETGILEGEVEP